MKISLTSMSRKPSDSARWMRSNSLGPRVRKRQSTLVLQDPGVELGADPPGVVDPGDASPPKACVPLEEGGGCCHGGHRSVAPLWPGTIANAIWLDTPLATWPKPADSSMLARLWRARWGAPVRSVSHGARLHLTLGWHNVRPRL